MCRLRPLETQLAMQRAFLQFAFPIFAAAAAPGGRLRASGGRRRLHPGVTSCQSGIDHWAQRRVRASGRRPFGTGALWHRKALRLRLTPRWGHSIQVRALCKRLSRQALYFPCNVDKEACSPREPTVALWDACGELSGTRGIPEPSWFHWSDSRLVSAFPYG